MKVFVTGAAGYIGSVVVEELLSAGHDVFAYDLLKSGHRNALPQEVEFVQGDILDGESLLRALGQARPYAVMHLAGEIVVSESFQDPGLHFRVNVSGGIEVLEAMREAGINRIVFSSTAGVYGDPGVPCITENVSKRPLSPYGLSKLQFEQVLDWYGRTQNFKHVSLRYFNACGATEKNGEDRKNETHLIPIVIEAAMGKRAGIKLYGTDYPTSDGTCVRDYVHVSDIARAHVTVLEALDGLKASAYNLGTGRGHSNREVIDTVRRVSGWKIMVEEVERRPGDPAMLVASAKLIEEELGWKPQVTELEDMVASAWRWRQAHPNGYGE